MIAEREYVSVPGHVYSGHLVAPPAAMPPHEALAVAVLERLVADLRGTERAARTDARAAVDGGGLDYWLECLALSEATAVAISTRLHALAHPSTPQRLTPQRLVETDELPS